MVSELILKIKIGIKESVFSLFVDNKVNGSIWKSSAVEIIILCVITNGVVVFIIVI